MTDEAEDVGLWPELLAHFTARTKDRRQEVAAVLAVMTKRERALVREVAVMTNAWTLYGRERPAPDSEVVYDVIARCISMPDLCPTIARLVKVAARRRAPTQHQEPT